MQVTDINKARLKKNDPERYFDGKVFCPQLLAEDILHNYCETFYDNKKLYIYHNGKYIDKGDIYIKKIAQNLLSLKSNSNRIKETIDWIKNETAVSVLDESDINPDDGILNVKNGLLNYKTGEFKQHTSRRLSTIQLPVNYDPDARDPTVMNFIKSIVPKDTVSPLLEFLGYCLTAKRKFAKAIIFLGEGKNGKSAMLNVLQKFFGEDNISNVRLQDFDNNRFKAVQLYGKLINIFADLPADRIKDASIFKTITGGDRLNVEFKGKDSFNFTPFAKLIFSANKMPPTNDKSEGFYRRLMIIPCTHKFTKKDIDIHIEERLSTDSALSTLFNLALDGLNRLEHNQGFTPSDSIDDALDTYRGTRNNIDRFIDDKCLLDEQHTYSTADLHNEYITYCNNIHIKPIGKKKFNDRLETKYKLSKGRKHGQPEHWQGIKLK